MKEQNRNLQKRRTNPYTQVANAILNDRELSLKSKGLYAYMYSKPENWNFTASSMAAQLKESRKTILKMLSELKNRDIVEYVKNSDGTGKYILDDELPPKSQNDTLVQNSQSPKMTPCKNDTVSKWDRINNRDIHNKTDINNNPTQGSNSKRKVKLNLSQEVAEFRQKLINSSYVGHLAPVMVEGEKEDAYINEQGLIYTQNRTPKQIVSSTLNEIWEQLHEAHASKYGMQTVNPIKNLKINKFGA